MTGGPLLFPSVRAMATMVHAIQGAVGELSWSEGRPIEVRAHPSGELQACALRQWVAHALVAGSCDALSAHVGRRGEPSARLVPGSGRADLGGGVQRFVYPHQIFDVFATVLDAVAAGHASLGAATLPASFRAVPCHQRPPGGLGLGLAFDELTQVSLVWLVHPAGHDELDEQAAKAAWAMAGACAATEVTLGI